MPAHATAYEHIAFDGDGTAFFKGTRFKVMQLLRDHVAYGWSAEELALNHPPLTLGQVHAALAWYADHREELDKELEVSAAAAAALHAQPKGRRLSRRLKQDAA